MGARRISRDSGTELLEKVVLVVIVVPDTVVVSDQGEN